MTVSTSHLQPLKLDITNPSDIAAAAACQDVTLLINNAGVGGGGPLLAAPSMEGAREEIETNYLGTLAMCRAFAPLLGSNGGGVLVTMLSVFSWYTYPFFGFLQRVQGRRVLSDERGSDRTAGTRHNATLLSPPTVQPGSNQELLARE